MLEYFVFLGSRRQNFAAGGSQLSIKTNHRKASRYDRKAKRKFQLQKVWFFKVSLSIFKKPFVGLNLIPAFIFVRYWFRLLFDFRSHKRHIFLKFYYLGWDYQGFATQEDTTSTIEYHLFNALTKSCTIESRETSNYHRCGRTDKGVSAFSQVISVDVRSRLSLDNQGNLSDEIRYCKILNRLLPKNIRCISWSPAAQELSARFDCNLRCYKYFFPRGNLNVEAMDKAAKFLIGSHDFRNLCKMDVGNGVISFVRNIQGAEVIYSPQETRGLDSG